MKKILFATTALVAMGGTAYADSHNGNISLSGSAEIGFQDGDGIPQMQLHGDMDIKFTLSGTSDNGLTFGATIDTDEFGKTGAFSNRSGPHSVFVSGVFGTLTVGDTDGAYDKAMIEIAAGSALADDHSSYAGYSGNAGFDGVHDGQIMRYDYAFGDFSVAVSIELDDSQTSPYDDAVAIGGKWATSFNGQDIAIGAGYQDVGLGDLWGVSGRWGFGDFSVGAQYQDGQFISSTGSGPGLVLGVTDFTQWGLGATWEMGPWLFHANYSEAELGTDDFDGFGVAINYDFGGGLVAELGYGDGTCVSNAAPVQGVSGSAICTPGATSGNGNGDQTWSFGLAMAF